MPLLIGWMIGTKIGDAVASRTFGLMALWLALPGSAMVLGNKNWAPPAGFFAAIVAMLGYALYRPNLSARKLAMLTGLLLWCRLIIVGCAVILAVQLVGADYDLRILPKLYKLGLWAGGAFAIQTALRAWDVTSC